MSLQMRAIAVYLRLTAKRSVSTPEKTQARLTGPKGSSQPPDKLEERHDVSVREVEGFLCWTVRPRGSATDVRAVVYLHGGAYVGEISKQHWDLIEACAAAGVRVEVPLYGLAPQYGWRDAYRMVTAVYRDLLDEVGAGDVTIAGDSAGGGLALGFAQTLVIGGLPQPRRLVLISPWLDLTLSNRDALAADAADPFLTRAALIEFGRAWAHGDDPELPELSPLRGTVEGLAPLSMYIGTRDQFYPDVVALQERADAAGAASTLTVCEGGVHVYPLVPAPEGRAAHARIVEELAG